MIRKILIVVVVLIILLFVVAAAQPDAFEIKRSEMIDAPPAVVFSQVNDLHAWPAWSPWAKLDPNMQTTYEGPGAGVGASYAWVGNSDVGEGKMTIIESQEPNELTLRLEFLKPFEATNTTTFSFHGMAAGTHLTWGMQGENSLMGKVASLFMDMDAMVGKDFEKGLAALKEVAESEAQKAAAAEKAAPTPEPAAVDAGVDAAVE